MTEHETLIESELRIVDEALERGVATAPGTRERELEEMALALAAQAPEPRAELADRLGERVREGFPRPRRVPRPALPKLRRPPMIALAGAASILAALAVAVSLGEDARDESAVSGVEQSAPLGEEQALPDARIQGSGRPDSAGVAAGGFAPGAPERRIERSASLTLAAPEDRLEGVANEIIATTDRFGGFVLRSSVSTGEEGASTGGFELRIPAARLQPALRDLSKLGDVRARTQSGQDITRRFVSAGDRLQAARAERRGLLTRLESAGTDLEAESIRRRLDIVAAEINGLRGQLRGLRLRSDYATVAITLEREGDGSSGDEEGGLGSAFEDALGSVSASGEMAVRAVGVAAGPALLLGLLWLGSRVVRRRRREAVLGG